MCRSSCSKRSATGSRPAPSHSVTDCAQAALTCERPRGWPQRVLGQEVSLRNAFRMIAALGIAALMLVMALSTSAASDVIGHVYVNDNTAGNNTIAGFDRHSDGSLTPPAGSPFAAGGQGTGTVVGSQGALQVSGDGRYLLAADAGSNQISVLRIRPDRTLGRAQGSPGLSAGFEPWTVARRA